MKRKSLVILVGVLFSFLMAVHGAFAYSTVVSFGDSLSDNGFDDGYGLGVATNGDVWVEYLADQLDADLLDLAYCGARTYGENSLGSQVDTYLGLGESMEKTLYTVWCGGNDLLNMDPEDVEGTLFRAVSNIAESVALLAYAGADDIVVMNMPNLGATPRMNGDPESYAQGMGLAMMFNAMLAQSLAAFNDSGVNLILMDVFGMMDDFIINGVFDNDRDPLAMAGETSETYLFWDAIHPTTYAHSLIADAVYAEVAPVPEPATLILLGTGLIGCLGVRRKRL